MHKDPRFAALFEFDPEIKITFYRLKRHCQFGVFEEGTPIPTMANRGTKKDSSRFCYPRGPWPNS